ncbi:hypothetical protein T484DRAFT_1804078 [Baffinella frigidus]|nr:hypothetical protein T484DRAFT_1804078 [Cryptophyta sp. CCMP2293]
MSVLRALSRAIPRAAARSMTTATLASPARQGARVLRSPLGFQAVRNMSSAEIVARQAGEVRNHPGPAKVVAKVKATQAMMMGSAWTNISSKKLDEMVEGVGTGRDFVNSLSPDEEASVSEAVAAKGQVPEAVAAVEEAEAVLTAAIKSDQLFDLVRDLRMEMEDFGTRGDGDNIPGSFSADWDKRLDEVFTEYSTLLEGASPLFAQARTFSKLVRESPGFSQKGVPDFIKLERELGYQFLLIKRVVHIESFRFLYPKVHPSGFSATSD